MAKRVLSLVLLFCLISVGLDFVSEDAGFNYNNVCLAPSSPFSDVSESVYDRGDLTLASIVTQMIMKELDKVADISGPQNIERIRKAYRKIAGLGKMHSGIDFRSIPVTPYFREISDLGNGEFLLPVSLSRPSRAERADFHFAVSAISRDGLFPMRLATDTDLSKVVTSREKMSLSPSGDLESRINKFNWYAWSVAEEEIDLDRIKAMFDRGKSDSRNILLFGELEKLGVNTGDLSNVTLSQITEALNGLIRRNDLADKIDGIFYMDQISYTKREVIEDGAVSDLAGGELWSLNRAILEIIYSVREVQEDMASLVPDLKHVVAATKVATLLEDGDIPEIESLSLDAWTTILFSRLFSLQDYRFVLDFVEKVKNMDDKSSALRKEIFHSPLIAVLYLSAIVISPEEVPVSENLIQGGGTESMDNCLRATGFFSENGLPEDMNEDGADVVTDNVRRIIKVAKQKEDLESIVSMVDAVEYKAKTNPTLFGQDLGLLLRMNNSARAWAKDQISQKKIARAMARDIAILKGAVDADLYNEYINETFARITLYTRRAVAATTGTETSGEISSPQEPAELGAKIVVKQDIPEELDLEAREYAVSIVNAALTVQMLKSDGILKNKVSEKTSVVCHLAETITKRYYKMAGKDYTIMSFIKEDSFFRLFEHYLQEYLSVDLTKRLELVLEEMPWSFWLNGFHRMSMADEFAKLGLNISEVLEKGSALIFSEKVTFNKGLGIFLAKLARSDIKVAVIATNDIQRGLIDAINRDLAEDQKIKYAETIAEVRGAVQAARYYYFKVEGDPENDFSGITTCDITGIVDKIIETIGALTGIVQPERIRQLHNAALAFAEAA